MQDLRITVVQADQRWEDKTGNFANYSTLLEMMQPSDLILLPEMFNTGFTMNAMEYSESMSGESVEWLLKLAAEKQSAVYTSLIIEENGVFFNRGICAFPDGKMAIYDKRKCFSLAGEDKIFQSGTKENIIDINGWKINLQICYDLRFPENVRNGIVEGIPAYDVLLYVANWPKRRIEHWKALLKARAIENQCFVAGCNRVGHDGEDLEYDGWSQVIDALGNTIGELSPSEEGLIYTVLQADDLKSVRERLPFLIDSNYRSLK